MEKENKAKRSNSAPHVRLIYTESGRGLKTDADLLQETLESCGCRVERTLTKTWSISKTVNSHRIARIKSLLPTFIRNKINRLQVKILGIGKPKADLQIHLESLSIEHLNSAKANWLIPNQEWFRPQHVQFCSYVDKVLCKTLEAYNTMKQFHERVDYIGFSNPIVNEMPAMNGNLTRMHRFLHVAGKNRKKGTLPIINAWKMHPEWPQLTVVIDDDEQFQPLPFNIKVVKQPDNDALLKLRRNNGIALAPSEVEGYGHIFIEAMANQQVAVTTNASPMNEVVKQDRGYLIPWRITEPCHLGHRYFVSPGAVENCVNEILNIPSKELFQKSLVGRMWCLTNHYNFISAIEREISAFRRQTSLHNHSNSIAILS